MARHGFGIFIGAMGLWAVLAGGCSTLVSVQIKPSECVNPPAGDCTGAANESRILDVRMYQLKLPVDPCQLDLDAFAQGKDLDLLKSALVETQRTDAVIRMVVKVAANEPRNLGTWELLRETQAVLAVALGRGKSKNSARLISMDRIKSGHQFPTLYFRGYDICLDKDCQVNLEAQCHP